MAAGVYAIIGNGLWATARPQSTFIGDLVRGVGGVTFAAFFGAYVGAKGCALGLLVGNITGLLILLIKYQVTHSKSRVQGRIL
jgi:hypothetical protein